MTTFMRTETKKKHLKASAEGWNSDASTFFFLSVWVVFFLWDCLHLSRGSVCVETEKMTKPPKGNSHCDYFLVCACVWHMSFDTASAHQHLYPSLPLAVFFPLSCALPLFHFLFLQPVNPHDFLIFLHQRSAWLRWRSAAPNCLATLRAWYSVATNAPSHAPVTRPCSCTCRSTLSSSLTSASSAITTAVGGAS